MVLFLPHETEKTATRPWYLAGSGESRVAVMGTEATGKPYSSFPYSMVAIFPQSCHLPPLYQEKKIMSISLQPLHLLPAVRPFQ